MFLVDHQANKQLAQAIGAALDRLSIEITAHIKYANALELDWSEELPETTGQTYIFGNPPFIGARIMSKWQKAELGDAWGNAKGANRLDYVTAWHAKAKGCISQPPRRICFRNHKLDYSGAVCSCVV